MKNILSLALLLCISQLCAQPDTEVYVLDITTVDGKTTFTNLRNISNNVGYDNQPSFYDDNTIIYASTRNGQTDIAKYDLKTGTNSWLTDTPVGGEYSPTRIPNSDNISAVRLDTTGYQRLYHYDIATGKSKELLKGKKVGYHVWLDSQQLFTSVLAEGRMDLFFSDLSDNSDTLIMKNVGRSLHKIPNIALGEDARQEISFIANYEKSGMIESYSPITKKFKELVGMEKQLQDYCWLTDDSLLIPKGNQLLEVNPEIDDMAKPLHTFTDKEIYKISRLTVSPNRKHLAIVSEESPAKIVQKQVDSYNASNLDAFVNCYSQNVVVRNFPVDTLYVGHEKMRKNYNGLSPNNKNYNVEVVKRIVIGNKVIDQEKVTGKGKTTMQVAIYEVNNTIDSMTFIFDDDSPDPEGIVQQQMEAYNSRDIGAFLDTYDTDVEVYNYPNEVRYTGKEKMRESYSSFFDSTPDLNYIVKNRMVIANIVIDEEYITANGNSFSAVAVYEVEDGKIAKVTFLR